MQSVQAEHVVSALSKTRREALAPWHSSAAHALHPVPQMQTSGTKVRLEAMKSLGNSMTCTSCKAGYGTEEGKIKNTLNSLQSVFLVVFFRRTGDEGFSMLPQLGMLPWSPTTTIPHILTSIQRQRFLSFRVLPLLSLIWWKQECWVQS